MEGYDVAQICINGHVITSMAKSSPQFRKNRCDICGGETIMGCPKCNTPIKGYYHISGVIGGFEYEAPRFCDTCGSPFPWIENKLNTIFELIDMIETISNEEKVDLKHVVEDLVRETSKVSISKVKFKRYLKIIDNDISNGIKEVLTDILREQLKNEIL